MSAGISTYDMLVDRVKSWTERGLSTDDTRVADNMNTFVNITEEQISTSLKLLGMKRVVTGTLSTGASIYAKPNGWKSTISWRLRSGSAPVLYQRTADFVRRYWPDPSQTGTPKYFCDIDYGHFLIGATPDANYAFELEYYEIPEPLSPENQTNWFLERCSSCMLYGTLREAFQFLKRDGDFATWDARFKEALGIVKGEDLGTMVSESQRKPK